MADVTDYLEPAVLQQLQDIFTLVTRAQFRIYGADGQPITAPSEVLNPAGGALPALGPGGEAAIVVEDETLGRIILERPSQTRWPAEQMNALADALDIPRGKLRQALQRLPEVDDEMNRSAMHMSLLLGDVIRRLCRQERDLRARIEELATLYNLTGLFTGHRDLRHVLDTVVQTVVDVMKVKGCGLRLLNAETNELTLEASAGLSEEYLQKGKVTLEGSDIDRRAFETADVVYVEDERKDPRVMFPEQTRREGIVSALIVPLIYKGRPVGALRLYSARRQRFSPYEVALIKAIAAQAAAAIVNTRLYEEYLRAEAIRRQVYTAGAVQRRMIPHHPPELPGLDIATIYVPSLELSGDFYDFIHLPGGNLGLAICDVMGKGVPAGLLMASIRASLRAHADSVFALSEILRRVNRSLCDDTLTMSFATLFYGVINTGSMELTYANAGHEPPLLIRGDKCRPLTSGGTPLGIDRDLQYGYNMVQLQRDDVIVMTTDGLTEAMNFQDEQFGAERVTAATRFAIARGDGAHGIAHHILWEMRRFAGLRERGDDVTLVVARITQDPAPADLAHEAADS